MNLEYKTNRPGGDYGQRAILSAKAFRTICSADGTCQAVTFVKPSPGTSMGQCYLTQTVPAPAANGYCIPARWKSGAQEVKGNIR